MRILALLAAVAFAASASAEVVTFEKVQVRFPKVGKNWEMIQKDADLRLDDETRTLSVQSKDAWVSVGYDDVEKIVFDETKHMRGGKASVFGALGSIPGIIISTRYVHDYWCYIQFKAPPGAPRITVPGAVPDGSDAILVEINSDFSERAVTKMRALFDDRLEINAGDKQFDEIDKKLVASRDAKVNAEVAKVDHPIPEIQPDKALVLVVGQDSKFFAAGRGAPTLIHANDEVIAAVKSGTYAFSYVNPGDYLIVSQSKIFRGDHMTLEAGKGYYFLLPEVRTSGFKNFNSRNPVGLAMHSRELVMYELQGVEFSDWTRKK